MKKFNSFFVKSSLVVGSALATFALFSTFASAAVTHIVISQVQVGQSGTGNAGKEFVELYNPTNASVSLSGLKLKRKTSAGTETVLVDSLSGDIAAHSYFLIGSPLYDLSTTKDFTYSTDVTIAADNTVLLYDAADAIIDKVGMGTATDRENTAIDNPATGGSIQRKIDDTLGRGLDTDNNSTDFEQLLVSTPRNSTTVVVTPTPTMTASPTGTATASATPTASPTATPTSTATATPTQTATSTPTATPTVTPSPTATTTASPTATATTSATPTITPTVTPTPSGSATPSPTRGPIIGVFNFPGSRIECRVVYLPISSAWFFGVFPSFICSRVM